MKIENTTEAAISKARQVAYLEYLDLSLTFEGGAEKAQAALQAATLALNVAKEAFNRIAMPTEQAVEELAACANYTRLVKKMAKRVAKGLPSR